MSYVLQHKVGPCAAEDGCAPGEQYYQAPVYGPFTDPDTAWEYISTLGLDSQEFDCIPLQERIPLTLEQQHFIACQAVADHVRLNIRQVAKDGQTTPVHEVSFTGVIGAVKQYRTNVPGSSLKDALDAIRLILNRPQKVTANVDFFNQAEWEADLSDTPVEYRGCITEGYASINDRSGTKNFHS